MCGPVKCRISVFQAETWENVTSVVISPGEKSAYLTDGSIAGIVLGCLAAVAAFSKKQPDFLSTRPDRPLTLQKETTNSVLRFASFCQKRIETKRLSCKISQCHHHGGGCHQQNEPKHSLGKT